jgi:hypothetical protein
VLDESDRRRRLDAGTSPATKIALRRLFLDYRRLAQDTGALPSVWDTGFRIFSQVDEDGVLLFLLAAAEEGPRTLVDLGAGDGVHASNCANLLLNLGYDGLLVDADADLLARAQRFYGRHPDTKRRPPVALQAFLTRENVNDVVRGAGFEGEVDLLSIDVDGNDYWLWEALDAIDPRFVVAETHPDFGLEDYVMPYDAGFDWREAPDELRHGASPVALAKLGERLGYRIVGANLYGFNVVFARSDVVPAVPGVSVEELLRRTSTGFSK